MVKKYYVLDLENEGFMEDTIDEPMTLNNLRKRFWDLDDTRTKKYKDFNKLFIENNWNVKIIKQFEN